MIGTIIGLIT